jgi:hypothetical protein
MAGLLGGGGGGGGGNKGLVGGYVLDSSLIHSMLTIPQPRRHRWPNHQIRARRWRCNRPGSQDRWWRY